MPVQVPGLALYPDYVTADEESAIVALIDTQSWLTDLKRRVQHYGYRYDYKRRVVEPATRLGPLPSWLAAFATRFVADGIVHAAPNQVIINEYLPGQGIAAHIDSTASFGDTIVSLSLLSPCVMTFTQPASQKKVSLLLAPRSLLAMREDARYHWAHAIASRKGDMYEGQKIPRGRRISLTFRNVLTP